MTQRLELCIVTGDGLATLALPEHGKIIIGRDVECDVTISDPSASRRHAALHLAPLALEDLGGANGTRIRSWGDAEADDGRTRKLRTLQGETTPIAAGDIIAIGTAVLVLRRVGAPRELTELARPPSDPPCDVIAEDPATRAIFEQAALAAASRINVLVLGETGAGKELVARAVHLRSPRAGRRFLALNCAALPETLFESELFGHEKGAFTGATIARPGLLEAADGGTVFLDEVGEMPLAIQLKLLRVVEDRKVQRVGSRTPVPVDVRLVSATNRDLDAAIAAGHFRADLYYRLAGITLTLPPLRSRPADVAPLARAFAVDAFRQLDRPDEPVLSPDFLAALERFVWPGNVRELRNVIERAVVLSNGAALRLEHLPSKIASQPAMASAPAPAEAARLGERASLPDMPALEQAAEAREQHSRDAKTSERDRILYALERCGGNQTQAARLLGIARRTLINRIEEFDLPRPRKKEPG